MLARQVYHIAKAVYHIPLGIYHIAFAIYHYINEKEENHGVRYKRQNI